MKWSRTTDGCVKWKCFSPSARDCRLQGVAKNLWWFIELECVDRDTVNAWRQHLEIACATSGALAFNRITARNRSFLMRNMRRNWKKSQKWSHINWPMTLSGLDSYSFLTLFSLSLSFFLFLSDCGSLAVFAVFVVIIYVENICVCINNAKLRETTK